MPRLAPSLLLALLPLTASAKVDCWIPHVQEGDSLKPKYAPLLKALTVAENAVAKHKAFLDAPEPVRMQAWIDASDWGGSVHVYAFPKQTPYAKVWMPDKCAVYPASITIAAQIGQISVRINSDAMQSLFDTGRGVRKQEGTVAGYPIYDGTVVITKNGRLPWIPQTLADRLDQLQAKREKELAEWKTSQARAKPVDMAALEKTAEMIRKTDPKAAEKMLASVRETAEENKRLQTEVLPGQLRQLEKAVAEVKRYRAAYTPEQLAAPAQWTDRDGAGRKAMETRIRELNAVPAREQQEIEALNQQNRALTKQMNDANRAKNAEEAERLRAQIAELTRKARTIRQRHMERTNNERADLQQDYELAWLKPGDKANMLAFKVDPSFPDRKDVTRPQVITVTFYGKKSADGNGAWQKSMMESFDYAALAALLR